MSIQRKMCLSLITILAAVMLAGCFETTLNLGSLADAKVDRAMCGEWTFSWQDDGKTVTAKATVVNFDEKQFYVQWSQEGEPTTHMKAYLAKVADATFAQVTGLGEDEPEEKHLIVRVELKGEKLMIRHLDEKFFAGIKTDAELRKKVDQNVNNDALYEGPWLAGAKVAEAAAK